MTVASPKDKDAGTEVLFELYHENSKIGRHTRRPDPGGVGGDGPTSIALAEGPSYDLAAAASEAATPDAISQNALAALLARAPDSEAALDLYFHARAVAGLPPGLYRHDRAAGRAVPLAVSVSPAIRAALLDPAAAAGSLVEIFVVATFAPLAARYGERGYRYALIETGRLAAGIAGAAAARGFSAFGTGEFRDRDIDRLLRLDGVDRSTLYMIFIGAGSGRSELEPARMGGARLGRRRRRGRR